MTEIRDLGSWCQNAKTQFSQKLSNLELRCLLATYTHLSLFHHTMTYSLTGLFKEPIIGSLQSKMAEIRHLENRHDVIFFCWWWSDLDTISQTGTEWHVDCGDVEMETRCKIPVWRTFEGIQWHVIPEPRITLQGAATWWIHCHDSRAICHITGCSHLTKSMSWSCYIAECKNSIRHIENRFRHILIFFVFNAV